MCEKVAKIMADIDAANEEDPRRDVLDGEEMPFEVVYSRRMLRRLEAMYPDAPETLRIAAYGQHVRRFDIPRSDYPAGRKGYNRWRRACREHHARVLGAIMARHGCTAEEIAEVQKLVRKEELKKDRLSQALENVVDVVFVEHYLQPFIDKYADYDEAKLVDIIARTLLKMSPKGHAAVLALDLPAAHRALIDRALEKVGDRIERLADMAPDW
ncbi:MAG TPA: DUF4202 domain-containing protein [Thermopetrobacter sp.]|nr:DUF4202 domain-containing protein [Thermopetrobacter sp.]